MGVNSDGRRRDSLLCGRHVDDLQAACLVTGKDHEVATPTPCLVCVADTHRSHFAQAPRVFAGRNRIQFLAPVGEREHVNLSPRNTQKTEFLRICGVM